MSQTVTYGGVDIGGHLRLAEGITGMTSHADGSFGAGEATIDDPDADFSLVSLQEFIHEESACDPVRTFTGFLAQRRLTRGNQYVGAGRDHNLDILDLNYLLHLQPLRGATAKRPVETGDERMAWLMASVAMSGIVFDNGLIGSNPNSFDEADYTHQYADDVLRDLSVSSSAEVGRIFFVYYDHDTGEPSLFMDRPTVTSYTSTLSISNDLSDQSATCLAPYRDAELSSSGEDIYCSVFFKYKTGTVFRHNDATHLAYFNGKGYHRQGVFETTRVGSEATAIRHADAWLANHSGDIDTVTCQLLVPASQVNLIEAGMRVQCKFTHFPGFETFGYLRVASRTVGLYPVNDLYEMRLVLSNRTITPGGTGAGSTGDFPNPPTPQPQHFYSGSMLFANSNGMGGGGYGHASMDPGTTTISSTNTAGALFQPSTTYNWTLTMSAGTPTSLLANTISLDTAVTYPPGTTGIGLTQTPPNGANYSASGSFTTSPSLPPNTLAHIAAKSQGGGAQDVTVTWIIDPDGWEAGGDPVPPAPAQPVGPETVTMSGADGTTAWPFADGSLQVFVDNTNQTGAITAQDGAAGTFTLGFTPTPTEVVTVYYQGR